MNLRFLGLHLLVQSIHIVHPFLDLDVVAEEEDDGKKGKSQKVKEDFGSVLTYPQMPGFGGPMAEEKDIDIFFIQPAPLFHLEMICLDHPTNKFLILIQVSPVKHFFRAPPSFLFRDSFYSLPMALFVTNNKKATKAPFPSEKLKTFVAPIEKLNAASRQA
jgi:hypothetical protein